MRSCQCTSVRISACRRLVIGGVLAAMAACAAGGIQGDAAPVSLTSRVWTHVFEWKTNQFSQGGGQAFIRALTLTVEGDVVIFDGFVNSTTGHAPFTISEGDPISGFAGRWKNCRGQIRVAFIKHYYWPDELLEFSEPLLETVLSGTLDSTKTGYSLLKLSYGQQRSPARENLLSIVPSIPGFWAKRPDVRARVDKAVACD